MAQSKGDSSTSLARDLIYQTKTTTLVPLVPTEEKCRLSLSDLGTFGQAQIKQSYALSGQDELECHKS